MNETFSSPKEQLDLITSIVQDSRKALRENSFPFLVWGAASAVGTAISYALGCTGLDKLILPLWIVIAFGAQTVIFFHYRKKGSTSVKFFSSRIHLVMWTGIAGFGLALALVAIFFKTGFTLPEGMMVMSLAIGIGYLVSSVLTGYRALTVLGILWAAGGLACLVIPAFYAPAVVGSMAFCLEFIPGLVMLRAEKKS